MISRGKLRTIYQLNTGVIDCELLRISSLHGSYDVRIELMK